MRTVATWPKRASGWRGCWPRSCLTRPRHWACSRWSCMRRGGVTPGGMPQASTCRRTCKTQRGGTARCSTRPRGCCATPARSAASAATSWRRRCSRRMWRGASVATPTGRPSSACTTRCWRRQRRRSLPSTAPWRWPKSKGRRPVPLRSTPCRASRACTRTSRTGRLGRLCWSAAVMPKQPARLTCVRSGRPPMPPCGATCKAVWTRCVRVAKCRARLRPVQGPERRSPSSLVFSPRRKAFALALSA